MESLQPRHERESSPMVSIVIPVYNGANYLREAIDSALIQTYSNIEIIVVNDGSNDGGKTRDIALSVGDRVRYFEKANGGVASALNVGIREMRGDYFSWLSHDDVYYPDKIARQLAQVQAQEGAKTLVFCNYHVINHATQIIGTGLVDEELHYNSILLVVGTQVGGCSLLIPKAAFKTVGPFNESLTNCQDNEMWLRLVMEGYRLRYLPDVLIQSRQHAEQGSRVAITRQAQESRAFYAWALQSIGELDRVENAAGLFRILLLKRLMAPVGRLFQMLQDDRWFGFALLSLTKGVLGATLWLVIRSLAKVPVIDGVMKGVKMWRFQGSSKYWERRYRKGETSGVGSYGKFADYKATVLNDFITAKGIVKVAEFGCGDGNQLKTLGFSQYLGVDISPTAVQMCKEVFHHDQTKTFLVHQGASTIEAIREFGPELTLSLDVVYHLVEDAVFEDHITNLFRLSSRYVIIYSTDFDRRYYFPHQVDRKFTNHVETSIKGWKLLEVKTNPLKGVETQSSFHIYEKM